MNMNKLESEAPGFTRVYESVKRLALFHKIEEADCQGMALVAVVEHPGCISAAIRAARRALNAERRQRLPGRPINDRVDAGEDTGEEVEIEADRRALPEGKTFKNLDEEGEYQDPADQDHEDPDQATPTEDHDTRCLPSNVHGLIGAIMFWAGCGGDAEQIAELVGRTPERIRQILSDPEAIRRAVAYAKAHPTIPGLGLEEHPPAPRKKIKHKPRGAHLIDQQDHGRDQGCLPLF